MVQKKFTIWTNTFDCDMYMSPFWSNERRDLAFGKNSLENIFPLWLYKTNEGICLHGSGWSLAAFYIKMLSFMKCWPLLIRNMAECLPSLFSTKPTAGWFWIYYYFVGMILPNFYLLLFRLLGQRYVVKESYGGSELGFSYCTWSSRIKKKKKKVTWQNLK